MVQLKDNVLSAFSLPGIMLGTRDTKIDSVPSLKEATVSEGKHTCKAVHRHGGSLRL